MTSWSDDCLGEKLTVIKRRWVSRCSLLVDLHILSHQYWADFIYKYTKLHYWYNCTYTYVHPPYISIYIYVCVCVCVSTCMCVFTKMLIRWIERIYECRHENKNVLCHRSIFQSFCTLAHWNLLTLFCFRSSGFFTAILPLYGRIAVKKPLHRIFFSH